MDEQRRELSFEQWVDYVFDRPVPAPRVYGVDWWEGPGGTVVEYVTRLFERPDDLMARYSRAQLAQGLWYIVSSGESEYMYALYDATVPLEARVRCFGSFVTLFERVFARHCRGPLEHLRSAAGEADPLNVTCFMWWDTFPTGAEPQTPDEDEALLQAKIKAMEGILFLPGRSEACIESALHGLGHEAVGDVEPVVAGIIDRFLAQTPEISEELRRYALNARVGYVL